MNKYVPPEGIKWSYSDHINFCVAKTAKELKRKVEEDIEEFMRQKSDDAPRNRTERESRSLSVKSQGFAKLKIWFHER